MRGLFWDLESTDLSASWGRILCSSFVELEGEPWTLRCDQKEFTVKGDATDDSLLAQAVKEELESADIIFGWNSILFDIPLLNARLAVAGLDPVRTGERHGVWHVDLMYYATGQSLRVGGKSLARVSQFLKVANEKTPTDGKIWQLAMVGDKNALNLIQEHCEADVLVTRDVWPSLAPLVKKYQFTLSEVWPFLNEIPSRRLSR